MGKKRGKDKSSREEDTDVIGRIYQLSGHMATHGMSVDVYCRCSFFQVHRADTSKREQTKLSSRNSLEIQNGQVARIARVKKIKKITIWNKTVMKSKKQQPYGCAWNVDIVWVFLNISSICVLKLLKVQIYFEPGLWPKFWQPACHQTLWNATFRSALLGDQFGQLECVVSICPVCTTHWRWGLAYLCIFIYIVIFCKTSRCYICNDEVYYSGTGHLAQLVNNLKKQASLYTPNTAWKGGSHCFMLYVLFLAN